MLEFQGRNVLAGAGDDGVIKSICTHVGLHYETPRRPTFLLLQHVPSTETTPRADRIYVKVNSAEFHTYARACNFSFSKIFMKLPFAIA